MNNYTFADVIFDPTSEKARNHIGKMVYFADNPTDCLTYANSGYDDMAMILESIQLDSNFPFRFGAHEEYYFSCIIPKKEEPEPKYIPFKNISEFIREFVSNTPIMHVYDLLIYEKIGKFDVKVPRLVTEMQGDGVIVGRDRHTTKWKELLERFVFENNEPCGKLQEGK